MRFTYILSISFLVFGCESYSVISNYDRFEEIKTVKMINNTLKGNGKVDADIQKFILKDGSVQFAIRISFYSSKWLFIEEGNSLRILIDGEHLELMTNHSLINRSVISGGYLKESAVYFITIEDLNKISNGKDVKVKIVGSNRNLIREFFPLNLQRYKSFILSYGN